MIHDVSVIESMESKPDSSWLDTLDAVHGLTIRAAWKTYRDDYHHHADCSKTRVVRYPGARGRINMIQHIEPWQENKKIANCAECWSLIEKEVGGHG